MMRAICLIAASALLTGCGSVKHVQVKVPVPVACTEQVPERPVMPTEAMQPGVAPWVLLRAALAEIDRREGYEGVMRAALVACTAPVE
ncbi:MAG: hypothetical protein PHU77_00010 [Simplicispira sp.]|nr:hypothetical protein [Simplicispira sp.]